MKLYGEHFCGNKISSYGLEHNRLDYATLAKAFDAVLANDIMSNTCEIGYWEQVSGFPYDYETEIDEIDNMIDEIETTMCEMIDWDLEKSEEYKNLGEKKVALENTRDEMEEMRDYMPDVYQLYIVSDSGARILEEIDEIVYYNDVLDLYLWGVTHWGTSWDYVLTDIPCNVGNECFAEKNADTEPEEIPLVASTRKMLEGAAAMLRDTIGGGASDLKAVRA